MKKMIMMGLCLTILMGCVKDEPVAPVKKGINVVKPQTKSAEADSTGKAGKPAHLPIAPVYGKNN